MVRPFRRFVSYNRYGYAAKVRNHLGLETTICYNAFNMVGSVTDANGIATEYTYSPAGLVTRIVRRDGADKYTYDYHVDGQLATATYGDTMEDFLWDGLALVKRGKRGFVNEPHVGGGNPVMSSDGTTYFNDMLGTTLSSSVNGETTASSLTAFGATSQLTTPNSQLTTPNSDSFFTGKPFVPGLGHAFLFRNYRSDLGKWQTADPLGYPDGWNQLAYGPNSPCEGVDLFGGAWGNAEFVAYYYRYVDLAAFMTMPLYGAIKDYLQTSFCQYLWTAGIKKDYIDTDEMGLTGYILPYARFDAEYAISKRVEEHIRHCSGEIRSWSDDFSTLFPIGCGAVCFSLGSGSGEVSGTIDASWHTKLVVEDGRKVLRFIYDWSFHGSLKYSDAFQDPVDVGNWIYSYDIETPFGVPYAYGHTWEDIGLWGGGFFDRPLIQILE